MKIEELLIEVKNLRKTNDHHAAYSLLTEKLDPNDYQTLLFFNHPVWWTEIKAGICQLSRRSSKDADFLKEVWKNSDFIYAFHRHMKHLPSNDQHLCKILDQDYIASISETRSIHWIVKDKYSKPWGMISLTDMSLTHKRSEVLLGILDGAPHGLALAAMLTLFQFYFKVIKFNKLVSLIYVDNQHSLKGTLHLGFKQEGHLRKHVTDPKTNDFIDLIQTGLVYDDAFNESNARLMKRLLS